MPSTSFTVWREELLRSGASSPIKFGDIQEEVIAAFGDPDTTSVKKKAGKPVILRYLDIEFHFDHGLFLIYGERDDGSSLVSISTT